MHDLAGEKLIWARDTLLQPNNHWMLEGSVIPPSVLLTPTQKRLTHTIRTGLSCQEQNIKICKHMHNTKCQTYIYLFLGCLHMCAPILFTFMLTPVKKYKHVLIVLFFHYWLLIYQKPFVKMYQSLFHGFLLNCLFMICVMWLSHK